FMSCDPNPCFNNVPCERSILGHLECKCGLKYVGEYCQTANPCLTAACQNNATCQIVTPANNLYSTVCLCPPGYNGTKCETLMKSSTCYISPCLHGGSCVNTHPQDLKQYRCDCPIGYMGMNCEIIDHCINQPCRNGGQCTTKPGGYTCTCPAGFTGSNCQDDIDECALNPNMCLNGGRCENQQGSYFCNCLSSYQGARCEAPYVPCNPDPCQNNGACLVTGPANYQCTCLSVVSKPLKCGNRILKACANSLDPDETPQNVASHQDPDFPYQPVQSHISLCSPISACAVPYQPVQSHISLCTPISACAVPYQPRPEIRGIANCVNPDETPHDAASHLGHAVCLKEFLNQRSANATEFTNSYYLSRILRNLGLMHCGNRILKALANSLDPDETPQNVASHQDPNCLLWILMRRHRTWHMLLSDTDVDWFTFEDLEIAREPAENWRLSQPSVVC
ncbi:hypothetical protein DPMN_145349, partial [Dreissena polymorpha]